MLATCEVFLAKVQAAWLINGGRLDNKAAFGAFDAWLSMIIATSQSKNLNGLRYSDAYKNFCLASSFFGYSQYNFYRTNLQECAAMDERNLRKEISRQCRDGHDRLLDCTEESMEADAQALAVRWKALGIQAVESHADEISVAPCFRYDDQFKCCVGSKDIKHSGLSLEEYLADTTKVPLTCLAQVVKFITVTAHGASPRNTVFRLRLGHAKAADECLLDEKVKRVLQKAFAAQGILFIGQWFDCTGRETAFIKKALVGWLTKPCHRALPGLEDHVDEFLSRRGSMAGCDFYHLLKTLRNAASYGSTPAPSLGRRHVCLLLYQLVGVEMESVKVKDKFADWRAQELSRPHRIVLASRGKGRVTI